MWARKKNSKCPTMAIGNQQRTTILISNAVNAAQAMCIIEFGTRLMVHTPIITMSVEDVSGNGGLKGPIISSHHK